jgi:cytochrome c oxidase subunit II
MWAVLPLFPPVASTYARQEDLLFYFLVALTVFFVGLIFGCIFVFAVRYRRRSVDERAQPTRTYIPLEIAWTAIPLAIVLVIFVWGAQLFFTAMRPPSQAVEITVVGKQWMWKLQHPDGTREINALHVPTGIPIKLIMTSEDVIHSFFIPAFRIKRDVVPGRYVTTWFEATAPGTYHLFCTQYCGTNHAGMIGSVFVMDPAEYDRWVRAGTSPVLPATAGAVLFQHLGCSSCHQTNTSAKAPALAGVFGQQITLADGRQVTADENFLREHILTPGKTPVAGYPQIMPTFQGLVSEDQILQLIAYIRSLAQQERPQGAS